MNASMKALSVVFPGRDKSSVKNAHWSSMQPRNPGPLSTRRLCGLPRRRTFRSSSSMACRRASSFSTLSRAVSRVAVDDRQYPERPTVEEPVGHAVHRPDVVYPGCRRSPNSIPARRLPAQAPRPDRKPFFAVNPVDLLMFGAPAFTL